MSVLGLAWRSLKQRPLASFLTVLSVALGVALIVGILSVRASTKRSFLEAARGYDLILGPTQGSPLTTTLNTLFHVGEARGTIPWSIYERVAADPRVLYAVPYAVGDSFRGRHVVATTTDVFRVLTNANRKPLGDDIQGSLFRDGRNAFEAVVGSEAAASTGLHIGSSFRVWHGVERPLHEHTEEWSVVGVLRPTGTPSDRAIFIPIETFYAIGGHADGAAAVEKRRAERGRALADEAPEGPNPADGDPAVAAPGDGPAGDGPADADNEPAPAAPPAEGLGAVQLSSMETLGLSAIGVRLVSPSLRLGYAAELVQDQAPVEAVQPTDTILELLTVVGSIDRFFELLAWTVVLVAGLGILVGLYNTIQGRRREIAILRALGARPHHVFFVIVLESLMLCVLGGILGLTLAHVGVAAAAPMLLQKYAVRVDAAFGSTDVIVLAGLAALGLLVGLLPAWRGLTTPVADHLHPTD